METLLQDVRYAARQLRRSPGFTAAAVLTLALGIGATTALFSAVDALLLRPLPLVQPERLVEVAPAIKSDLFEGQSPPFSYPAYEELRDGNRSLSGLAATAGGQLTFGDVEYSEEVRGAFVTGNYFGLLGVAPALGRMIVPGDDRRGEATGGVVLSHRLWQRRFGGDPAVVGRTVRLNGFPVTVLGVVPREFTGTAISDAPQLWAPLALHERVVPNSGVYTPMQFSLSAIGRLQPGVSLPRATAELGAVARQYESPLPLQTTGVQTRTVDRIPVRLEGSFHRFVALLTAATLLVLGIASANVAGMLAVRAIRRKREIAIRLAVGAGRARLLRQLVTEGVFLALLGGAAGTLLALWLTDLLLSFRWPVPVTLDVGVNGRVLGFAVVLSAVIGLVFSLLPALRASRAALVPALRDGGQLPARRRSWLGSGFVVGQVAMSLLLLAGAGLFLRALQHALSIDPGFDPSGVMVAGLDLHRQRYEEPRGRQLYREVLERVRQLPGVESASLSAAVPLGPGGEMLRVAPVGGTVPSSPSAENGSMRALTVEPDGAPAKSAAFVHANIVDPDFFRTMGIPLRRGRTFGTADREGAPRVAIVNQTMAERFWPDEDPIGERIRQEFSAMEMMMGGGRAEPLEYEVVGVVPDGKQSSLREEAEPFLFLPLAQNYRASMVLAVRTRGNAGSVTPGVRGSVHALDAGLPLLDLTPLTHLIGDKLLPQRIGAILTALFGALGLLLAAVGIYGMMAHTVSQRTREIGIRVALGATRDNVLWLVLGRGVLLALLGLAIGLAGAVALTRFIASLLYGVSATDPLTFAVVPLLLLGVGLLASYLPARRATRVDPMVALRAE